MKKLLLTLLISLNLAMPAHAIGGLGLIIGHPIIIMFGAGGLGTTYMGFSHYHTGSFSIPLDRLTLGDLIPEKDKLTLGDLVFPFVFTVMFLLDGEKNSENNLVQVDALNDIEALISANIYTETEGNDLKSEWRAFQSEKKPIFIKPEQIQGMSPEEVVATIQSQVGDRKLLTEYLASKMGIQVQ